MKTLFKLTHEHDVYHDYDAELLATANDEVVIEARLTLVDGGAPYLTFYVGNAFGSYHVEDGLNLTQGQADALLGVLS